MLRASLIVPGQSGVRLSDFRLETGQLTWNGIFAPSADSLSGTDADRVSPSAELIAMISDLLIVLDPAYCNFEFLSGAVRNGCHLFLTDRLQMSREERRKLIQLADEGGSFIQIRNDLLFHPALSPILHGPAHPSFIEIFQSGVRHTDHLHDLLFNNLLLILRIAGPPTQRVQVFSSRTADDHPALTNLHLNFANGSVASVTLVSAEELPEYRLMVHKSGVSHRFDLFKKSHRHHAVKSASSPAELSSSLILQVNDFIQKVSHHSSPALSLKEELAAFHLMEKIKEKLEIWSVVI